MTTQNKTTTKKTSTPRAKAPAKPKAKVEAEAEATISVEEAQEAVEAGEVEAIQLSPEQVEADRVLLEEAIAVAMEHFEFGKDEESFLGMTEKEQTFTRLLDPMAWIMREALITYEHEDCEECKLRRETGQNGLAVAVAAMIMGRV
jgi:hypothetical protein